MDWKDKGFEAIYVGGLSLIGGWFLKKYKPLSNQILKLYKISERVDELEKRQDIADRDTNIRVDLFSNKFDRLESRVDVRENTIKALLDLDDMATFILDNKGDLIYVNEAWLEITGLPNAEAAYGFGYMSVIPDEDKANVILDHENQLKHPSTRYRDTIRFQKYKTKIITEYFCKSIPIFDYKNVLHNIIGRVYIIKI